MKIAVDFDGTCVRHEYPEIGRDVPLAVESLKRLVANGHQLILYTVRSGELLGEAEEWFRRNDILLFGSQRDPAQSQWTASNKCYANLYIDDAACGCPLIYPLNATRPYVDWREVMKIIGE